MQKDPCRQSAIRRVFQQVIHIDSNTETHIQQLKNTVKRC
jgi:hypothetical protein